MPCLLGVFLVPTKDFDVRQHYGASDHTFERMSYWNLLKQLLKSKVYICVMLSMAVLVFTVTGIQFWITNYLQIVLNNPQHLVNMVFSLVSITGPTIGCIIGGCLTQRMGGYESPNAIYICFICSVLGCTAAAPVPFITNFWIISLCIWLLLFFGGAMVPPLTGIMISSVQPALRSFANSNTTTF